MTWGYWWGEDGLEPEGLVGQRIVSLGVSDQEHSLLLETDTGKRYLLDAQADCCSETWWADVIGAKQLLGARVTAVETIEFPDEVAEAMTNDGRGRQEVDEIYGVKIRTDRGACDLVFRNSSNGYYGGSCVLIDGSAADPRHFTGITEDWSA